MTTAATHIDWAILDRELAAVTGGGSARDWLAQHRPTLFSAAAISAPRSTLERIRTFVAAVEHVVALPACQQGILQHAPAIAHRDFGPRGAFTGFDFHITPNGPRLIEINTNAGGALLVAALTRATRPAAPAAHIVRADTLDDTFLTMFRDEWRAQRGDAPLRHVVITDDEPATQYLEPEFRLAQALFEAHGIAAAIVDAASLRFDENRLWLDDQPVDLVYNRLTDFALAEPRHAALRAAYESGAVVLTPGPRAHALYADKRNLLAFREPARCTACGIPATVATLLDEILPEIALVETNNAEWLWQQRKQYFFKPFAGFGSKAVYRGDKLTRRVWEEILQGGYLAQQLVPPAEWPVGDAQMKYDLRAWSYRGEVQLFAARLYQGQTTNFRTPGGGFAPVFALP
jgi:hypothetical protein